MGKLNDLARSYQDRPNSVFNWISGTLNIMETRGNCLGEVNTAGRFQLLSYIQVDRRPNQHRYEKGVSEK